ncbi:DUF1772 domain-containing protein [Amycolatopsis suaedae]|uniref:DUF1772 domain-containing protein n=1 Tax=Amycolatopsis suaedae TaxID=2510978 RepID=A0A4Q7J002_9PSEU|nr:anthrone oxygenase family protein [Amycolatopsis suaedae]RZQ60028.1 DUF1772 domain-containing protein [Amycolatopsis suaedae]
MSGLHSAVLVIATLTTGLSAGLFFAFSCSVMPGLRHSDDRSFVQVMQWINRKILNPWFLGVYLGALILDVLAVVLRWGTAELPWLLAGAVLYLVLVVITAAINVPLNNQLDAAGEPERPAEVRAAYEPRWVRWNLIRTVAVVASFAAMLAGLVAA